MDLSQWNIHWNSWKYPVQWVSTCMKRTALSNNLHCKVLQHCNKPAKCILILHARSAIWNSHLLVCSEQHLLTCITSLVKRTTIAGFGWGSKGGRAEARPKFFSGSPASSTSPCIVTLQHTACTQCTRLTHSAHLTSDKTGRCAPRTLRIQAAWSSLPGARPNQAWRSSYAS